MCSWGSQVRICLQTLGVGVRQLPKLLGTRPWDGAERAGDQEKSDTDSPLFAVEKMMGKKNRG